MFRRHMLAVISFPLAILASDFLLMQLKRILEPHIGTGVSYALQVPALIGCVLTAQSLVLYRRAEPGRKAEWSVVAPVLAAIVLIAADWIPLLTEWIYRPPGFPSDWCWTVAALFSAAFLVAICLLGAALASRWMDRGPTTGRSKGPNQQAAAVAILIIVVQGCLALAHEIAWRAFATPLPDLDAICAQSTLCNGGVLFGLLLSWLIITLVLWRGADRLSRWCLIAVWSIWVCFDIWMRDLYWVLPRMNPYEWTWALAIGVEAGLIAILYGRLVIQRLWARASPLSNT